MIVAAKQKKIDVELLDDRLKKEYVTYKGHENLYNTVN